MYCPATTAGNVLPCDDSRRCTALQRQQATHRAAMHFCASFALLRHGVRIFLATYTISNILYLLLFTDYDTLRKKETYEADNGGRGRAREERREGGMVVVTKKERRRAKAVGPKMILPGMFERRVNRPTHHV